MILSTFSDIASLLSKGEYVRWFFLGTISTILLSILGTVLGLILGVFLAFGKRIVINTRDRWYTKTWKYFVKYLCVCYSVIIRGTPMMVQALVIFYGVAYAFGTTMSTLIAGFVIVSLNTAAYMAEIIRSGLNSIDKGQIEGGRSLGLTYNQTMFKIVIPQAIKNVIPALGNELVVNIKDTSVLSVIMVTDLFYNGKLIVARWYAQFPVYFIVSVLYLIMTIGLTRILRLIEKKLNVKTKISNPTSVTTPAAFATNDNIDAEDYKEEEERRL
jgi:putative lysine transport system permease protein